MENEEIVNLPEQTQEEVPNYKKTRGNNMKKAREARKEVYEKRKKAKETIDKVEENGYDLKDLLNKKKEEQKPKREKKKVIILIVLLKAKKNLKLFMLNKLKNKNQRNRNCVLINQRNNQLKIKNGVGIDLFYLFIIIYNE